MRTQVETKLGPTIYSCAESKILMEKRYTIRKSCSAVALLQARQGHCESSELLKCNTFCGKLLKYMIWHKLRHDLNSE